MPFNVPEEVRNVLPAEAQEIFRNAANEAFERGAMDSTAMATGWTAVRNAGFKPVANGNWVRKDHGEGELRDQRIVNYRPAESLDESCGVCDFFVAESDFGGRCTKVAGLIRPDYTCELFEPEDDLDPGDIETMFTLSKVDEARGLAFGWANVAVTKDGEPVIDAHNEIIPVEELEEAAYHFVLFFREGNEMHAGPPKAQLIESVIFTAEKMEAMGITESTIPPGAWWCGLTITDPDLKKRVASGELRAFSIQGAATYEED